MSNCTSFYCYCNKNPQKKDVSDCVVRSIALATERHWTLVFLELVRYALAFCCMPNDSFAYEAYLRDLGWKKHKQPTYKGRFITGRTFLRRIRRKSDIIVSIGKQHMTVIHNGKFRDTWDCSNEVVGNYWTKGKKSKGTS